MGQPRPDTDRRERLARCRPIALALLLVAITMGMAFPGQAADPAIGRFLDKADPGEIVPGADSFGAIRDDLPVAPALRGGEEIGLVFLNSDFAGSVGYSGKPIHVLIGIDRDGVITGAKLVKHYEPIVLVGIPEQKVADVIAGYAGLDMTKETGTEAVGHDIDIISGATVTIMVIDDSIIQSAIKVARKLGLGGLEAEGALSGPQQVIDDAIDGTEEWLTLLGDGSVRRLSLDVGMINQAFKDRGGGKVPGKPEPGREEDTFIDLHAALVTIPTIGRSLLGDAEYANLLKRLEPGQHAILIAARGRYSFKGSGYVRGGIFDRISLVQGDRSVRFRDRQHQRLGRLSAEGAPQLKEVDLFFIPTDTGFDPAKPWRLQLLVNRATGPTDKVFLTFDLPYEPPARYLKTNANDAAVATSEPPRPAVGEGELSFGGDELWQRIWKGRTLDIAILATALAILTVIFFFQTQITRHERLWLWLRMGFLTFTLVWLGWYAQAQLSVVNVMTFANSLLSDFSWTYFMMDPLVFMLWFAVAAALIFWGRGAYCGWLCPFGALQELLNRLARAARLPQWRVPWGLHERLWPIKYILFLLLFGMSLYSLTVAEQMAEIEPFKTAIILKFVREWPFVIFAAALLIAGLFVERFYCRYLCPLGAALAIPGRLRMFDWLKRYRECGAPCQVCANDCMVQSIHPEGHINPNECLNCLHCQVVYADDQKCPVCVKMRLRNERRERMSGASPKPALAATVAAVTEG